MVFWVCVVYCSVIVWLLLGKRFFEVAPSLIVSGLLGIVLGSFFLMFWVFCSNRFSKVGIPFRKFNNDERRHGV